MSDSQEPNPIEVACSAACACARSADVFREVWETTLIDVPEGWIESEFEPIAGTVLWLTYHLKRSMELFRSVKWVIRNARLEPPPILAGTRAAATYHEVAMQVAEDALWPFDTALMWEAKLSALVDGPSIAAAELERLIKDMSPGSLHDLLVKTLESARRDSGHWCAIRLIRRVPVFCADALIAGIQHEAAMAI